jgi:hypothetical protein
MSKNVKTKIVTAVATISLLCPLALQATPMVASADWIDDAMQSGAADNNQAAHDAGAWTAGDDKQESTKPSTPTNSKPSTPTKPSTGKSGSTGSTAPSKGGNTSLPATNDGANQGGSTIVNNNNVSDKPAQGSVSNGGPAGNSAGNSSTKPSQNSENHTNDDSSKDISGEKQNEDTNKSNEKSQDKKESKNAENKSSQKDESISPATNDTKRGNAEKANGFGEKAQGSHVSLSKDDEKIPQTSTSDNGKNGSDWIDDAMNNGAADNNQAAHEAGAWTADDDAQPGSTGSDWIDDAMNNGAANNNQAAHEAGAWTADDETQETQGPSETTAASKGPSFGSKNNNKADTSQQAHELNKTNEVKQETSAHKKSSVKENEASSNGNEFGHSKTSSASLHGQEYLPQTSTKNQGLFGQIISWIRGIF